MSIATRILLALVLGLAAGIALAAASPGVALALVPVAEPVGTAWLNALQMTIIPLVTSLLITGIAATAEAVKAGAVAARAIALILCVMALSAVVSAVLTPLLLDLFPIPAESAAALRSALNQVAPPGEVPGLAAFFVSIVPSNAVAAAASSAYLSLIVFTLVFAFAITKVEPEHRARLTGFFTALRDAMLVMVQWIIWIAPVGVFALAYLVGARAGTTAFGALVHYIVIVSSLGVVMGLLGYPLAAIGGRMKVSRFAAAAAASQAVALSTQSSLATLPQMLKGAERMGVPVAHSGVILPLSVVMMRATGPAMNLAVAIYVGAWFGVPLSPALLAAATVVAMLTSLGAVSLPGQVSFISSIAPVAATMGVPVAPLGLLVAVEPIPDIFRTVGNVTVDLAATVAVSARSAPVAEDEADRMLAEG